MRLNKDTYMGALSLALVMFALHLFSTSKRVAQNESGGGNVAYEQTLSGHAAAYTGIYRVVSYTVVRCDKGVSQCASRELIRASFRSVQTLTINPDGSITASGACNGISGRFSVRKDSDSSGLRGFFAGIDSTDRVCNVFAEERIFIEGLKSAFSLSANAEDKSQIVISSELPKSGTATLSLELQKMVSFEDVSVASSH